MGVNQAAFAKRLDGHRVLIDTSVLIAYFNATDPTHDVATCLIDKFVRPGTNPGVICPVTAMEILVLPLKSGPNQAATVHDFLLNWPHLSLLDISLHVAQEAATLRATHNFKTPDALIIATGIIAQVGHLVTNDAKWRPKLVPIKNRVKITMLKDYLD